MKLILDHTQRLNLHALMGAQRANVDEVRMWWRLQDALDLSEDERSKIDYHMEKVGNITQPVWNPDKSLKPRSYEFSEDEYRRIEKIIREWQPGFLTAVDRRWLEPLLAQLDSQTLVNGGHAPTEAAVPARNRP